MKQISIMLFTLLITYSSVAQLNQLIGGDFENPTAIFAGEDCDLSTNFNPNWSNYSGSCDYSGDFFGQPFGNGNAYDVDNPWNIGSPIVNRTTVGGKSNYDANNNMTALESMVYDNLNLQNGTYLIEFYGLRAASNAFAQIANYNTFDLDFQFDQMPLGCPIIDPSFYPTTAATVTNSFSLLGGDWGDWQRMTGTTTLMSPSSQFVVERNALFTNGIGTVQVWMIFALQTSLTILSASNLMEEMINTLPSIVNAE